MKTSYLIKAMLMGLLLVGSVASAAERYTINYNDYEFAGPNRVVGLKQQLKRAYPDLDLRDAELESIVLVAKSRHGQGEVEFLMNGRVLRSMNVGGDARDFNRNSSSTFDNIIMSRLNARDDRDGSWQLRFSGDIKVRALHVYLSDSYGNPRYGRYNFRSVGVGTANKLIADSDSFQVRNRNAEVILIRALDEPIDIERVTVYYANGRSHRISQLRGNLRDGEQAIAQIPRGRNVVSIKVHARSRNLFESRARYEVMVGTKR